MNIQRTLTLAATVLLAFAGVTAAAAPANPPRNLEMIWIDTEGGAATLIITPAGESMLIDTGYPDHDRDATRINEAARAAGLTRIDHLMISHYHRDHVGGLAALTKLIPIGRFYGPNDKVELANREWYESYAAASAGKRSIVQPGDRIPLKGVEVRVVSANEKMLATPLNGGRANPLCDNPADMSPAGFENSRMVGVLLTFGKFTYLNLLDLDWHAELQLVCPVNKLGRITLYQASRHGGLDGAGSPALLGAIQPQVIVISNGPKKGLGQPDKRIQPIVNMAKPAEPYEANSYLRMARLPAIEGIWQDHLSLLDKDPAHNTVEDMIANLDDSAECKGNVIKASISRDGRYTVTNGRNGYSKTYAVRK